MYQYRVRVPEDFTKTFSQEVKQLVQIWTQEHDNVDRDATESIGIVKLVSDIGNFYSNVLVSDKLDRGHKIRGRIRWSTEEKKLVLTYFREHIRKK